MLHLIPMLASLVTAAPTITEIAPTPLPLGSQIEVTGSGYLNGQTTVAIGAVAQTVVSSDASHVRFAVAASTPLGPGTLTVTVNGESASAAVTVVPPVPRIDQIDPEPVVLGGLVTLEGVGLGTVTAAELDGIACAITNQAPTFIELRMPFEPELLGQAVLVVRSPSGEDGETVQVAAPVPEIAALTPNPVRARALLEVRGKILRQAPEVRVGGVVAPIVTAAPDELLAWLPDDTPLGSQPVIVRAAGKDSVATPLIVQAADPLAPIVRGVYPSRVSAGGDLWLVGEHLDQIDAVVPALSVTLGACEPRVCRLSTAGLAAGPPFLVALDGGHGAATFPAELVSAAPEVVTLTRVEPSPARRGEALSIFADNAAAVRQVVIGGQVQLIDFFDADKVVVLVHEATPLGSETLFVASNVGSEPFSVTILDAAVAPEAEVAEGVEADEPSVAEADEPKPPKDDGCRGGGGVALWAVVVAMGRRAWRRSWRRSRG